MPRLPLKPFEVRRAIPGEEPILRELRVEALAESPESRGRGAYERDGFHPTGPETVRESDGRRQIQMEHAFGA